MLSDSARTTEILRARGDHTRLIGRDSASSRCGTSGRPARHHSGSRCRAQALPAPISERKALVTSSVNPPPAGRAPCRRRPARRRAVSTCPRVSCFLRFRSVPNPPAAAVHRSDQRQDRVTRGRLTGKRAAGPGPARERAISCDRAGCAASGAPVGQRRGSGHGVRPRLKAGPLAPAKGGAASRGCGTRQPFHVSVEITRKQHSDGIAAAGGASPSESIAPPTTVSSAVTV